MAEEKIKAVSVNVVNQLGEKISTTRLHGDVFNIEPNQQVMFDAVQVYQANCRQATAKTKKRDEVSGGGKKPWRQKGTGRARAGSIRSPLWVGGGKVFGPTGVQNFKLSMNKEAHRLALKSALSTKAVNKQIIVLDKIALPEIKTKDVVAILKAIEVKGKTLLVVSDADEKLLASARNVEKLTLVAEDNVSVYDLLNSETVVFTKDAVKKIEEALE
jgi:large subunit ribosomal protein L4